MSSGRTFDSRPVARSKHLESIRLLNAYFKMNARQIKRLENKKRKMDALVEIKTLNEADKQLKRPLSLSVTDEKVAKKKSKLMLYLKHQGENARVYDTGLPQSRIPLFMSDIRDFLVYIVFNKTCPPYCEPRWCNISKKKIDQVILLVNEGFSLNDYLMFAHELPGLRDRFVKMEVIPPSSYTTSLVHELVMSSRHMEAQDMTPSKETSLPSNVTNSTHSPSQTIKSAFPIGTQPVRSANTESLSATSQNTKSQSQNIESAFQNTKSQSQYIESAFQNTKSQPQNIQLASQSTKSKSEIPLNDESKSATPQNTESQSVASAKRKSSESKSVEDKFPRTMLLLSALQMIEEDYPIPLRGELSAKFSKYINTKEVYAEVTPTSPLYGLDCEMCKTSNDQNELTRVTLVDEQENVVYESLVKPYNPITNYLTAYSGITRALLAPVATRLEHVQKILSELLPPDAILVGQSLNCDLHALKMMHPYVIDTSVIFNTTGIRTHKPKLKMLTSHFLGLDIQNQDGGHCSKEDAIAALRLVKLKLSKDPQFGDTVALQKCIRNINSKLSSASEVQNLFAYFDKIVTKKKEVRIEKTALVLTTDPNTETLYKKYLQTYRTRCKLITGDNNEQRTTNELKRNEQQVANDLKGNEQQAANEEPKINREQVAKENLQGNEGILNGKTEEGAEMIDQNESNDTDIVVEKEVITKKQNDPSDESGNLLRKESVEIVYEEFRSENTKSCSNQTQNKSECSLGIQNGCKCSHQKHNSNSKSSSNMNCLGNKQNNNNTSLAKISNRDPERVPKSYDTSPAKISNRDSERGSCKRKLTGTTSELSSNVPVIDLTSTSPPSKLKKGKANETNQCSENHKIITNPFSDEKSNEISNQFSKNNHKIITNLSSDEQSNEISNQSSKNNHKIITNQSSDKNSKISNHSIENAHKNLDEPNKAPEMSSSHKRLIEEMLQGSSNHSLVIGHTRQTVRSHLHAMVEALDRGLNENQLLVVLSVPASEWDKSSGVCFLSANCC
ncbi:hypothetical protein M8J77_010594 [Diaphorina citri]|nr:hypothetical protein M8J77_010594 [Diaphorina citri]